MSKLNLHIEIDPNSGFCFGVVNAIHKAEININDREELYCLGEIVHNEEEIRRLEEKGLKTISKKQLQELHDKRILFRAHGEPPSSYETAMKGNNQIIDATCPIIIKLQSQLRLSYQNNENIYIFGKKNHPEIIGLNGQIGNKAIVFETIDELDIPSMPGKITLYSQSTKSIEEFYYIVDRLTQGNIELNVHDSVCRQVSNRKNELLAFSSKFDKVLFVAGKNSSNGKVLFNFCRQANPNTFFISNPKEIISDWFQPNDKIGISGATSTPAWLMNEIKELLERM